MNTTTRLIVSGALFLLTLLSGVWLSHSGKPYSTLIFTIHKLIALGTVIFIGISAFNLYKALGAQAFVELSVIVVTGLLFLALFVTGALLSIFDAPPGIVLKVHQVVPLLSLATSFLALYLLTRGIEAV